jgi:hypothetical protein
MALFCCQLLISSAIAVTLCSHSNAGSTVQSRSLRDMPLYRRLPALVLKRFFISRRDFDQLRRSICLKSRCDRSLPLDFNVASDRTLLNSVSIGLSYGLNLYPRSKVVRICGVRHSNAVRLNTNVKLMYAMNL